MPDDVQGVTSPMVYIGMLFSWFAWHVEDHDLHSMNFLHTGAPKTWYAVPAEYASKLEEIVRVQGYGGNVDRLEGFCMLGEKTTLLSPEILKASGVPCCRLVQYPGEYVVTFPRAYHVGFSHGFNCGEAANFATPQWLNVAKEAAVRRAAMNYLPMLSHQHLLYLLTMSFVSRIPRELLSDVRSSRLRDRKKEEREVMVKRAFLEDMANENRLLCTLLAKDSASYVVLWEPELLPSVNNGSLSFPSSQSLEEHGSVFEDNRREIFHSSRADKVLFHCRRGTTGVENGRPEETVNPHSVRYHSVSSPGIQKSSCGLEGMGFNVETLQDIDNGGDDLPCGLNVASGSLTCLACGVLGYPLMAIMQPSERAERELFPINSEEFHRSSGKSEHVNSTSSLLSTVRKLNADYSKEAGIMSVAQSNLDSSCILYPESGDHAPSTEASNAGCGFGSLNVDPKGRSSDFDTTIDGIGGMVSLPSSAHPDESCSDGQQCWVRSKELKNSMLVKEKGSEHGINKKWSTSNRSMRPRIFCLQHALEIEELLQCKGGGNMLIICHSDYNKIKAHAISVTEDIGIKFNCKDVPLESASSEDLNLINIAIDDDHDDHEDWTSKLGLNLRYCVKLRKQSSENQEQLPLALRGIFSNPSPTFISNLKWHSRKIRTPYKVIGMVETKSANDIKLEKDEPVKRSSNTDSLKETEAYQSHKCGRSDIANKHSGDPRAGTPEELSNKNEIGELTSRAAYVTKSGPAHFLNDHVENISVSVPTLSAESTHVCTDAQPEAKINVSYDINFTKSGDKMQDISTENLLSVPTISVECTHLSTDVRPEAKISVSDDIDFARSGSSVPFVNSHIGACIHPNGLNRKMAVCNSVLSQCPSSEMLQDLLITGKSCSNSKVCGLEKSEDEAGIMATEDDGQHEVVRGSDDSSSAHKFNEIINSVDSSTLRAVDHYEVLPEVSASGEDNFEGRLCNSECSDYESTSLSSLCNNFETQRQVSVAEEAEIDTTASSDNNSDTRQLDEVQLRVSVGGETETDTSVSTEYDSDTRQPELSVLRVSNVQTEKHSETYQEPHSASEMEENDTSSNMRQEIPCESELDGDCRIASSRRQKQVDSVSENEVNGCVNSFEVQHASETEERVNPDVTAVNSRKPPITLPSENIQSNGMHYLVETRTTGAHATGDKDHCLENSTEECRSVAVYKTYFRRNKRKRETENTTGGCTSSVQGLCEVLTYVRKNKRKREIENTIDGGNFSRFPSKVLTYVRRNKRKKEIGNPTNGGSTFIRGPCEGLRPRSGRTEFGQNEVRIVNKEAAKMVKKPKRVDRPVNQRGKVGNKGAHKCDIYKCGMRFKTEEELLLHKSNLCTYKGCGKHFSSHKYIVRHQIVHDDLRPLKCPWKDCNMSFKWSWARIEHIRTHTGERPYKCKVEGCGKTFRFVSAFSSHRRKSGHNVE